MTEEPLICLVYVSRATRRMTDQDLLEILRAARGNNAQEDITGLLLYRGGCFMQALEGPNSRVQALYRRISMDERHTGVTTLIKFQPEGRAFSGWSMGFAHMDRIPEEDRASFTDFLDQDFQPRTWVDAPHRAMRLLVSFRNAGRLVEVGG